MRLFYSSYQGSTGNSLGTAWPAQPSQRGCPSGFERALTICLELSPKNQLPSGTPSLQYSHRKRVQIPLRDQRKEVTLLHRQSGGQAPSLEATRSEGSRLCRERQTPQYRRSNAERDHHPHASGSRSRFGSSGFVMSDADIMGGPEWTGGYCANTRTVGCWYQPTQCLG